MQFIACYSNNHKLTAKHSAVVFINLLFTMMKPDFEFDDEDLTFAGVVLYCLLGPIIQYIIHI